MRTRLPVTVVGICLYLLVVPASAQTQAIPPELERWRDWATWQDKYRDCPTPYFSPQVPMCFWPSRMTFTVDAAKGTWSMAVNVYNESWIPIPGSPEHWPTNVRANGNPVAVVARQRTPSVQLTRGTHALAGEFRWESMPQKIAVPGTIGLLALTMDGSEIPFPTWDANGDVWLHRTRTEGAEKDLLAARVYRLLDDGIPLWLHTEVELTVSGKSREEALGTVLPHGWRLSHVDSPIPIAIDDQGRMKAQVRAGKWNIALHAFRTEPIDSVEFGADAQPIAATELIAFQANPTFRLAEIQGIPSIDVTQTTFPERWRGFPVYFWKTNEPFQLVEKLRGRGGQRPEGLHVERHWWLDEDGSQFTYVDRVTGQMQEILRLDATDGQDLGAVRIDGIGQLITKNPNTGAHGVEVRTRNLNLEGVGRMSRTAHQPATGWQADVNSLSIALELPPGWRLFALFGADDVDGDWLTAWTLWDLFLLLILALAVFRLWGFWAGMVAFVAFGLSYHEFGAPRFTWLLLLMPVALLRVVSHGAAHRWISAWKMIAAALLILCLIPFLARQIQNAIYPQLELPGTVYTEQSMFRPLDIVPPARSSVASREDRVHSKMRSAAESMMQGSAIVPSDGYSGDSREPYATANLMNDPSAKIQTGPADPNWSWIRATCRWNGPVAADQTIRSVFVTLWMNQWITAVRVVLLVMLVAIVLDVGGSRIPRSPRAVPISVVLLLLMLPHQAFGQFPDATLLNELRQRLLEPSDAYPQAAEIANVALRLDGNTLLMRAEVHTAIDVAVPMPGRLPGWSPLTVEIDGVTASSVCRLDGFLWVLLPKGVHTVVVEGLLPDTADWEWTFQLKPRHVTIDAPEWTATGVGPNGIPSDQVIFARQLKSGARVAAYDRRDFQTVVAIDRHLEIGLVWQVRTQVTRLSDTDKALSIAVPVLPGERVLTSDAVVQNGFVEVALGAGEKSYHWESELPIGPDLILRAGQTDRFVERWHLVTSPVWHVATSGLAPVFEAHPSQLVPVWHPWPGEEVKLKFARPAAIAGDTVTVRQVSHSTTLGARETTHELGVSLECSLGEDFAIELDPDAKITILQRDGLDIPVRRDGPRLIVPIQPGQQRIDVSWRTMEPLRTIARVGQVALPITSSNVTTVMNVPVNRWVLWANGPMWGPAVRFWIILPCAVAAGLILSRLPRSPLGMYEWVLLAIGLTQVPLVGGIMVVGWLFLLAWRGQLQPESARRVSFNLLQIVLVLLTFVVLMVLVMVLREGLLGRPEMFIVGNGSTQTHLRWFQPLSEGDLPEPWIVSVSLWFYRLLMLLWALWLASALLRWLVWGWQQFSRGTTWR